MVRQQEDILISFPERWQEEDFERESIQQIPLDRIQIADITPSNFYYQPILTIISLDIMALFSDKTFKPDIPVTGQEAMNLLDIILTLIE